MPHRATAVAHPNIAFIKYWGNRDDEQRLPANGSISVNLAGLETRTTVEFDPALIRDELTLQGSPETGAPLTRVSTHLDWLRRQAGVSWRARVTSENGFPMGAGIASSASAFAALTVAGVAALGLRLPERALTRLARRGSGSASRSVPAGFVEWFAADRDDGSFAQSIATPDHWALVDLIAILDPRHKAVGSAEGSRRARTSPYQEGRVADAPRRLRVCREAILRRDFAALAGIMEEDARLMVTVMRTSRPSLTYFEPATSELWRAIPRWRAGGLAVACTVDAGPNVHCLCLPEAAAEVERRLRANPSVRHVLTARPGSGARLVATAQRSPTATNPRWNEPPHQTLSPRRLNESTNSARVSRSTASSATKRNACCVPRDHTDRPFACRVVGGSGRHSSRSTSKRSSVERRGRP